MIAILAVLGAELAGLAAYYTTGRIRRARLRRRNRAYDQALTAGTGDGR